MLQAPHRDTDVPRGLLPILFISLMVGAILLGSLIPARPAAAATADFRISQGTDDGEENASGQIRLAGSDLQMSKDEETQTVGLRFQNIRIRRHTKILAAWLQFQVDEKSTDAASLRIRAERSGNARALSRRTRNITSRPMTAAKVRWIPKPWGLPGSRGPRQRTPNLAKIIQELVDRPDWSPGNAMLMVVDGRGKRVAASYNGSDSGAPVLHIKYEGKEPPRAVEPVISTSGEGPVKVSLSSATPNAVIFYTLDGSRPSRSTRRYRSPFELISSRTVKARAFRVGYRGSIPALAVVKVATSGKVPPPNTEPDKIATTAEFRISQSTDDAEERASGTMSDLHSSDLEMAEESTRQTVGLRFQTVSIPQGARITRAYIQFQVDESSSNPASLTIRGQLAANAPTFTKQSKDISSRKATSSSVGWKPAPWPTVGESGEAQRTPDLARVIQEIVNQESWDSGNALALTIFGSGKRVAESYSGSKKGAPLLHVEYVRDESSAPKPPAPKPPVQPTVVKPVISTSGSSPVKVSLASATAKSIIYYTLDGSNPQTTSRRYQGTFELTSSKTVKARAFRSGYQASALASAVVKVVIADKVPPPVENKPPVLTAVGNQRIEALKSLRLTISATDDNGAPKLVADLSALPAGHNASFDASSGVLRWTPRIGAAGKQYPITITAIDTRNSGLRDREQFTITVLAPPKTLPNYRLVVSTSPNRANSVALTGRSLQGKVYIQVLPKINITRALFYVDDPNMQGTAAKVEKAAPFDLAGGPTNQANPYDLSALAAGKHAISAKLNLADGRTVRISADFSVTRNAPSRVTLSWRSSADPVDGYRIFYGSSPQTVLVQLSDLTLASGDVNPYNPSVEYDLKSDLGASTGDKICFRVVSYDSKRKSPPSDAVCGTVNSG